MDRQKPELQSASNVIISEINIRHVWSLRACHRVHKNQPSSLLIFGLYCPTSSVRHFKPQCLFVVLLFVPSFLFFFIRLSFCVFLAFTVYLSLLPLSFIYLISFFFLFIVPLYLLSLFFSLSFTLTPLQTAILMQKRAMIFANIDTLCKFGV